MQAFSVDAGEAYAPGAWAAAIVQLVEKHSPDAVVAAASDRGQEAMAHAAARLDLPLAANCVSRRTPGDPWQVVRQRWGGSLLEEATLVGRGEAPDRRAARRRGGRRRSRWSRSRPSSRKRISRCGSSGARSRRPAPSRSPTRGSSSAAAAAWAARRASRVLEELAALLGGAVGGSRVVTNLGWRAHADQVGQTGAQDRPRPLHRLRDQRRDPAHRRLQGREEDPRDQQGPARADARARRTTRSSATCTRSSRP